MYFVFPIYNGNCEHCWSNNMVLGKVVSFEQHCKNIDKLLLLNLKEMKLSSGEPFFNKDIGRIIDFIKKKIIILILLLLYLLVEDHLYQKKVVLLELMKHIIIYAKELIILTIYLFKCQLMNTMQVC